MKAVFSLAGALVVALAAFAQTNEAGIEKEIHRLMGELGAPKYAAREAAQKQLLQIGDANYQPVLDLSLRTYATTQDPEVKLRLRGVMARLVGTKIFDRPRGYLGVQIASATALDEQQQPIRGITVLKPVEDGVAEKAGIQAGDLILKLDDLDLVKTPSTLEFTHYVQSKYPGDKVKLVIKRGAGIETIDAVLGELPKDMQADLYGEDARKEFCAHWLDEQLKALTSQGKK